MRYMWEFAASMGIEVTHVDARHIDMDTFEADLPGELVDLMPCDWCGKPVIDLIPFYGEAANPTTAQYMICEDCNAGRFKQDEYERSEEDGIDSIPF